MLLYRIGDIIDLKLNPLLIVLIVTIWLFNPLYSLSIAQVKK